MAVLGSVLARFVGMERKSLSTSYLRMPGSHQRLAEAAMAGALMAGGSQADAVSAYRRQLASTTKPGETPQAMGRSASNSTVGYSPTASTAQPGGHPLATPASRARAPHAAGAADEPFDYTRRSGLTERTWPDAEKAREARAKLVEDAEDDDAPVNYMRYAYRAEAFKHVPLPEKGETPTVKQKLKMSYEGMHLHSVGPSLAHACSLLPLFVLLLVVTCVSCASDLWWRVLAAPA